MSLLNLSDDKIYEICESLNLSDLSRFIQSSKRIYDLCSNLIVDKYMQRIYPDLRLDEVREYLKGIAGTLAADKGDPELDIIYPIIVNDPRANVNGDLFAEAFKQNLKNTVKAILDSGKLNPNNPEIFKNIVAYDDEYDTGHEIMEFIAEDPRVSPESLKKYERDFLASQSKYRGIKQKQFREFNLYKYNLSPELIREVSEDIELSSPLIDNLDEEAIQNWIEVYLKNIYDPTAEDIAIFLGMNPTQEQAREFIDRFNPTAEDFNYFANVGIPPEYMSYITKSYI